MSLCSHMHLKESPLPPGILKKADTKPKGYRVCFCFEDYEEREHEEHVMGQFVRDVCVFRIDIDIDELYLDASLSSAMVEAQVQSSQLPSLRQWQLQVVRERNHSVPWLKAELKTRRHELLQAILTSAPMQALGG